MDEFARRRMIMVDTQVRPSDVTKFPIIEAMLNVPREVYVPDALREASYVGENLALAPDRVLLEPRTLAKMLDALDIRPGELVLDIGAGYGYSSAVIARMADAVVAVEASDAMAAEAQRRLSGQGVDTVAVIAGPLAAGSARHAPYDVITIQGGVEVVPDAILSQLREGGRIGALFFDGNLGTVRVGLKQGGQVSWRQVFNAAAPVLPGFERARAFSL